MTSHWGLGLLANDGAGVINTRRSIRFWSWRTLPGQGPVALHVFVVGEG